MDYNYHTHTWRCRHAIGESEEYIKTAIERGIKNLGFSEHAPFIFPDGYESDYRLPFNEKEEYINELIHLREKYKNEINIKIGFEMEYYPLHFEKMLKIARECGAEYLILGQHFIFNEYPNGLDTFFKNNNTEHFKDYINCVIEAMDTGVFSYIAHPDLFCFTGADEDYDREYRRICVAAREKNIPLEINFQGIRSNRHYPNEKFWSIAGEEKSPVVFGADAHSPCFTYDSESIKKAKELVKKFNLNYIGAPKIVSIL